MDRYTYVLRFIEAAHNGVKDLPNAIDQLNGHKEVRQRLVTTYGTERVSSSAVNSNPALEAIIRCESDIEALEIKIALVNQDQEKVRSLISIIKNRSYAQILEMYCYLGWSHGRIARSFGKSVSTIKRKKSEAINIIAQELNKKEAGA